MGALPASNEIGPCRNLVWGTSSKSHWLTYSVFFGYLEFERVVGICVWRCYVENNSCRTIFFNYLFLCGLYFLNFFTKLKHLNVWGPFFPIIFPTDKHIACVRIMAMICKFPAPVLKLNLNSA